MSRIGVLSIDALRELLREDKCPECLGELDTGFECLSCGFDALPLVKKYIAEPNREG